MKLSKCISIILLALAAPFAHAGNETQNGGSIVVDGKRYELADLHFTPLPYERFGFDEKLTAELNRIRDILPRVLKLNVLNTFFSGNVFSSRIEYRFVASLPESCRFLPIGNLPENTLRFDVGCTEGSITYLLPEYFSKLDIKNQALLLIHERLHDLAPREGYDVKADFIAGLNLLVNSFEPAFSQKLTHSFAETEWNQINRLTYRMSQLLGTNVQVATFIKEGTGICFGSCTVSGEGVEIIASFLGDGTNINGSKIVVSDSELGKMTLIAGDSISLISSKIGDGTHANGSKISVSGSQLGKKASIAGESISISSSQLKDNISLQGSLAKEGVEIIASTLGDGTVLNGSKISVSGSELGNRVTIAGDSISISASQLGESTFVSGKDIRFINIWGILETTSESTSILVQNSKFLLDCGWSTSSPRLIRMAGKNITIKDSEVNCELLGTDISIDDSSVASIQGKNITVAGKSTVSILNGDDVLIDGKSDVRIESGIVKGLTLHNSTLFYNGIVPYRAIVASGFQLTNSSLIAQRHLHAINAVMSDSHLDLNVGFETLGEVESKTSRIESVDTRSTNDNIEVLAITAGTKVSRMVLGSKVRDSANVVFGKSEEQTKIDGKGEYFRFPVGTSYVASEKNLRHFRSSGRAEK